MYTTSLIPLHIMHDYTSPHNDVKTPRMYSTNLPMQHFVTFQGCALHAPSVDSAAAEVKEAATIMHQDQGFFERRDDHRITPH